MSNCKVIACYFGDRKEYPSNEKNTIDVLKDVVKNEQTLNPGVSQLDTILVNHDCGKKDGNEYLNSIDGLETYSGKIKVIHRPWNNGIGASFGSGSVPQIISFSSLSISSILFIHQVLITIL